MRPSLQQGQRRRRSRPRFAPPTSEWIAIVDADGQHAPGGCACASPPGWASTTSWSARAIRRTQATPAGGSATRVLNWLASYLTERPIPDLTSGFRAARRECLLEFIHLLPNGFSTPTTTHAGLHQGRLQCGVRADWRARARRHVEDPARQRRRQVSVDLAEGHHHFQPASHLRAHQRGRRSRLARPTARGTSSITGASPTAPWCCCCSRSSSCSSAWCRSRSRRCVSRGDAPRR